MSILNNDITYFVDSFELYNSLKDKKFLITGSTGLIGSIMVRCLIALNEKYNLNIRITCLVRSMSKAKNMFEKTNTELSFYECDLSIYSSFDYLERDIDYIIHCANPTASLFFVNHPVETLNAAICGSHSLLEYSRKNHISGFVYISSLEVYGTIADDTSFITEEQQGYINPLDVRSSYSMGKRTVECMCHAYAKEYNIPIKIARLTQTFGAGISADDNRVFAQFARSIINNEDIILHTKGQSSKPYCYTIDAVSAILYILLKGNNGEAYNVANEETYISIKNMAEFLRKEFNSAINVIIDIKENMGYSPVTKLKLATDKIKLLGWTPHYNLCQMFDKLISSMV